MIDPLPWEWSLGVFMLMGGAAAWDYMVGRLTAACGLSLMLAAIYEGVRSWE